MLLTLVTAALLAAPSARADADRGELVIVEVMAAAGISNCEWIEVATTGGSVDLDGCNLVLVDPSGETETKATSLDGIVIPSSATASSPAVLARDVASCRAEGASAVDCVAWDAKGNCLVEPTGNYTTIGISNSDPRTICIACGSAFTACDSSAGDTIVDEFSFEWDADFGGACDDDYTGGCSTNYCGTLDVDANDVVDDWSVPDASTAPLLYDLAGGPMLATPGDASACPPSYPTCSAGDLVISEIMTTPPSDVDSHEWLEVKGVGTACDLDACWLVQLDGEDIADLETDDKGVVTGGKFLQIGRSLPVVANDYVLLGYSSSPIATDPLVEADYDYGAFRMSTDNADRQLAVYCGGAGLDGSTETSPTALFGELVDSAPMVLPFMEQWCPQGGCSMNLESDAENSVDNDETSNWCIPPLDNVLMDGTYEIVATPGEVGSCQTFAWPGVGEMAFTEFMPDPAGTQDWLEMHNISGREVELNWCVLSRYRIDPEDPDADENGVTDLVNTVLTSDQGQHYPVAADGWQVFSYKSCLLDPDVEVYTGDTGEEKELTVEVCPDGEFVYEKIQMTTSNREYLELSCGGDVIDVASVDAERQGLRDGHSAMLDPEAAGSDPVTANDDPENWCEAAFTQECLRVEDENGVTQCNYGTPGQPNECKTDLFVVEGGPGCMCSSAGSARLAGLAAVVALMVGLVRRRPR